jgi:limonene-1,2-epoxide hydrolase
MAARRFVQAFNEGDLDGFVDVLDPGIEIHSMKGLRQGREQARQWATRMPGGVQQTIEVTRAVTDEGRVLLDVDRVWRWDEDGSHASTDEMSWLFEVSESGLVTSWKPFEDRAEAARAFRA